jgi:CBS domain-containing protein
MAKDIQLFLNSETVSELEPSAGVRVSPSTSVRDTVALMQQSRSGCALVCEGSKLVGIFTEQDYLRRVVGPGCELTVPVSECMSRNPATIRVSDSIATLVGRIHQGRYRRLPVLNEQSELVGCVTVRDLIHHLAEHFPAAVYNLAPVSKPIQQNREGA